MSQNIRIGVNADAGGAASEVAKIDKAAEGAADSIKEIAREASGAEKAIDNMAKAAERMARAKAALERETGTKFSDEDTRTFLDNFDRMKRGRQMGARRLRQFDDFDGWYQGHNMAFGKASAAAQHRRSIFAAGLQGTRYAAQYGGPPAPEAPGDGGRGGFSDNPMARRGGAMLMRWAMGGLALAGVGGFMAMAGKGAGQAGQESVSADTLKRATGDLAVDFMSLRNNVRDATEGLGVAYLEGQKLASQFARESGHAGVGELDKNLRTGIGFSRSYGMDPAAGVGFFGSMRRLGVVNNDQDQRRLALMIGDAVAKSGNSARADEVLQAIQGYAEQTSRLTLTQANVGAYGSYLTSLMQTGRPGLDPSGAAAILGAADNAVRRGGAMGEASLNFSLAAMLRNQPGLDPITAKGMLEGGLFGTANNTFGAGASLGDWYASKGLKTPTGGQTNFEMMMPMLRRQYGANSPYLLEAIKNHFGLNSLAQAAEMDKMYDNPANLQRSQDLLGRARLNIGQVSATGIQQISRIANASSGRELGEMYDSVFGRKDLTEAERASLSQALRNTEKSGNVEDLKAALVAVVGTREQEETEGTKTRNSITGVENAITRFGNAVLPLVNTIRDAVDAIAKILSPGYRNAQAAAARQARVDAANGEVKPLTAGDLRRQQGVSTNPNVGGWTEYEKRDGRARSEFNRIMPVYMNRLREAHAGSTNGEVDLDSIYKAPDPALLDRTDNKAHWEREYYRGLAVRQHLEREYAKMRGGGAANPDQAARQALDGMGGTNTSAASGVGSGSREGEAMTFFQSQGWSRAQAAGIVGNLIAESGLDTGAVGDGGQARGIAQWHPDRKAKLRAWARRNGKNPDAYRTQLEYIQHEMFTADGGNVGDRLRQQTSASGAARVFADHYERPAREADGDPMHWDRRDSEANRLAGTVPTAVAREAAARNQQVGVEFAPAVVTLQDVAGRPRGQVTLNPFTNNKPAGAS